jgi:hypothetical protein
MVLWFYKLPPGAVFYPFPACDTSALTKTPVLTLSRYGIVLLTERGLVSPVLKFEHTTRRKITAGSCGLDGFMVLK